MGAAKMKGTRIRRRSAPRVPSLFLFSCTILLSYSPGKGFADSVNIGIIMAFLSLLVKSVLISAAVVTLDSILIYKTHDWLPAKKTVYFQCKGEHSSFTRCERKACSLYLQSFIMLDHLFFERNHLTASKPLTELKDTKCKRCGFYEKDAITTMTPFDEWEFCASDFTRSDGRYVHLKEKRLMLHFYAQNVSLLQMSPRQGNIDWNHYLVSLGIIACGVSFSMVTGAVCRDAEYFSNAKNYFQVMHWILVAFIAVLVSAVVIAGFVTAYKYGQKRKRQQEQARFLRLFEEGDDIEDELGIGPLSSV
ncbi:hypothetical protein Sango_1997900 [Sesamum angolense]|uniref:DUF7953 domain-containing protein n=1 Tax=Sesamum angolense TaxID=2727404 RepID=A0AAE1WFA6_9LAMI|nr:hypothetical protein Sango_1997900 [Sesamum angolense]